MKRYCSALVVTAQQAHFKAPTNIQSFKVSKSVNMGRSQMCRPRPYWVANISSARIYTRSICCLPAIHTAARATVKTAAQMIRTVIQSAETFAME